MLSVQLKELLERGGKQTALAYLEATSAVEPFNRRSMTCSTSTMPS